MIRLDLALRAFKNVKSLEFACEMLSISYSFHGFDRLLYPEKISTIITSLSTSVSETELLERVVNWHKIIGLCDGRQSKFIERYRSYKRESKPEKEVDILTPLILGNTLLDFGSGEGYFSKSMMDLGFEVTGQEVNLYKSDSVIRYEKIETNLYKCGNLVNVNFDTTLVKSTMHHIKTEDQHHILESLTSNTKRRFILWEEIWGIDDSDKYSFIKPKNPNILLTDYMNLDHRSQYDFLIIVDFVGNLLIGDFKRMDLPFSFCQKDHWVDKMHTLGFELTNMLPLGFVDYMVHRSCHLIMVFDRK